MPKKENNKRKEVLKLLRAQKIRDVKQIECYKLSVCHPYSAGIDLGSREIYLALSPAIAAEMDGPIVHVFSTYTQGLAACKELLLSCGVKTFSMESTSVYWTTIFSMLQSSGIEVCLVNPKKFRMVPGRKTDILDCQWLQTLHYYGLLRGSFVPQEKISELRSYMRERDNILKDRARYVQRMQKALTKMNLLLHNVLSDITGQSGLNIIRAILAGERDPKVLASLRSLRVKCSEEEIIASLSGYYKQDQLYLLQTNYDSFVFFTEKLYKIDSQIEQLLKEFPLKKEPTETCPQQRDEEKQRPTRQGKNGIRVKDGNLNDILYRILGSDITTIPGLQANTILQIISEVGTDMSKFPTANHFASYLGFVPHNKITGGRIMSSRTDRINSPAAQAFKKVIPSISQRNTALGAFYRRIVYRVGTGKAVVATCRKLAIAFYYALTQGKEYIDEGKERYLKRQEERERKALVRLAEKYNMQLKTAS
jgi:transposase